MREYILNVSDWLLPPAIFRLLTYYKPSALVFYFRHLEVLRANKQLYNRHAGERCFILCNGPSVNRQNIRPLKSEIVFSVSSGYLHPDFTEICPRYHCIPQLTYGNLTESLALSWFKEVDEKIINAELFLDGQEWSLVKDNNLFNSRKVNYLCMGKNYFPRSSKMPDLAGIIPRVQTVPVLVVMLAMYMGFKDIYIVGADHDWFIKKEYKYAFELDLLKNIDPSVNSNGQIKDPLLLNQLPIVEKVWSQYRALNNIAKNMNVNIYNSTDGGVLDEFERVPLDVVMREI